MKKQHVKNPTVQDIMDLNRIERVRVRQGHPKGGYGFSLSIYGIDQKYSSSIKYGPIPKALLTRLYEKMTTKIDTLLAADDERREQAYGRDVLVIMDDTPVDELVNKYKQSLLYRDGDDVTLPPTVVGEKRAKKMNKLSNLSDFVESFDSEFDAAKGVFAWHADFCETLTPKGFKKSHETCKRAMSETRGMFAWLHDSGDIPYYLELKKLKSVTVNVKTEPYFTISEVRAICAVKHETAFKFQLAAYTGMRLSEVLRVRWSDIEDDQLEVLNPKNGRDRFVTIMPQLMTLLNKRLAEGHSYEGIEKNSKKWLGDDFLFDQTQRTKNECSQKKDMMRILKLAGVSHLKPKTLRNYEAECAHAEDPKTIPRPRGRSYHAFRYTWASCMLVSGVDHLLTMMQLGHQSVTMTARYSHIAGKMKEAKDWKKGELDFK